MRYGILGLLFAISMACISVLIVHLIKILL
jgi:hypothetical protein